MVCMWCVHLPKRPETCATINSFNVLIDVLEHLGFPGMKVMSLPLSNQQKHGALCMVVVGTHFPIFAYCGLVVETQIHLTATFFPIFAPLPTSTIYAFGGICLFGFFLFLFPS